MGAAAGPAVRQAGDVRVSLRLLRGFNFDGGHEETKGLTPDGQVFPVALHRHAVSLDFTRVELGLELTVAPHWDLLLRLPFDVKEQAARVEVVDATTAEHQVAADRNLNIHHRAETYRGPSDPSLLAAFRTRGLFRANDLFRIALGATVPLGRTEDDPFVLGDQGLEHLHIQFGSGTVDGLFELQTQVPLASRWAAGFLVSGRIPMYENNRGYRGARTFTSTLDLHWRLARRLSLQADVTLHHETHARWSGERDPNSGLTSSSGTLGLHFRLPRGGLLSLNVRQPLSQHALTDGSDTLDQGPTVLLGWSHSFERGR